MLDPNQIEQLLEIIDKNHSVFIGSELGIDYLSTGDKRVLTNNGIDWRSLYSIKNDSIYTAYHLGLLADSLKGNILSKISFEQLKEFVERGQYIPLTSREKFAIKHIKLQTLKDLKSLKNRIFNDINQILIDKSLRGQRTFIKREIASGLKDKKTIKEIASSIATKTGDWNRDFTRIVSYNVQDSYEAAKAQNILNIYGKDTLVYKSVFSKACKHCIKAYLTAGPDSEPKVFKLEELLSNGTNIGRKVDQWLPVIGPVHPYCRCSLKNTSSGYKWNGESKMFDISSTPKRIRPLVDITIGDKTYKI